jgi:hypothetical protein
MKTLEILKWIATATLIIGSFVNSLQYYPLGPWLLVLGGAVWLGCALLMRDRQLIVTNSVMLVAGSGPLVYQML